jgi:hypothetical protein
MTSEDTEKAGVEPAPAKECLPEHNIHEYQECLGYEVNIDASEGDETAKLASDGRTRLIPQPSDDTADPLNWPQRKKNLILFVVAFSALLPDYGSATGAVTLIPQAE